MEKDKKLEALLNELDAFVDRSINWSSEGSKLKRDGLELLLKLRAYRNNKGNRG